MGDGVFLYKDFNHYYYYWCSNLRVCVPDFPLPFPLWMYVTPGILSLVFYAQLGCRKILRGSNLSFFFRHFPFQAQQYCQLRHVISLWRLLTLERAKILIRRGEVRNMNISTCNLHDISKDFVTTFSWAEELNFQVIIEQKQCRLRSTPQKTKNKNQGDWKATFELSRKINEKVVTPCNRNKRKQPIKASKQDSIKSDAK